MLILPSGCPTPLQRYFSSVLPRLKKKAKLFGAHFSLRDVSRHLGEPVRLSRDFARANSYLAGSGSIAEYRRTAVALQLCSARTLALLARPLMPDFAAALLAQLGEPTVSADAPQWDSAGSLLPERRQIGNLRFREMLGIVTDPAAVIAA